ncbi:MAG: L-lactate permease [Gemmataceae bacterium]
MPWAVTYTQNLNPVGSFRPHLPNSEILSTFFAAIPVLLLFCQLVRRRWLASKAGAAGALSAILIAWLVFEMPLKMAGMSFVYGVGFGLLPIGWTIFCAMLIYNITVETGQFAVIRRSVAGLSGDARIQAILIGFAFGAFLEGAAGAGSPVAICGAMLIGLGFDPFTAAVICLIANTSPVAYGGLGTPVITLAGVTDLSDRHISAMAGRQLPILSCLVPFYMVKVMCTWRKTLEVWPALLVGGGSFAAFQFVFSNFHTFVPKVVLYPMTDVGGGIFSLVVTAVFLKFWRPKREWHFDKAESAPPTPFDLASNGPAPEVDVKSLLGDPAKGAEVPLTPRTIARAWMPFALMSLTLMGTGLLRQREGEKKAPLNLGPIQSYYAIEIPTLHQEVARADRLKKHPESDEPERENAVFNFTWLTSPGTPVFFAALLSIAFLRMNARQILAVLRKTVIQMKIPIPTIAFMIGLSYVTRYAGMDATLGIAFAETGTVYPFFAAILGWLGVFLTGTDAGSNALFGSLQKITATQVYHGGAFAGSGLGLEQAQVLICTANSTGGVMGKMIDAQSICVATAATNQLGKEADIFKAVLLHSFILASIVGILTLIQAYVPPFTRMVP